MLPAGVRQSMLNDAGHVVVAGGQELAWLGAQGRPPGPCCGEGLDRRARRPPGPGDLRAGRQRRGAAGAGGETNHFVHEKADFRLWCLRRLAGRRPLVVGEELSWSDGHHVGRYLRTGDPAHLDQAATFGGTNHRRADRDDQPTGIFKASYDAYPTALFKAEQARFYHGLRALPGIRRFFGFDIDAPGAGYLDLRRNAHHDPSFWRRLRRVRGESITEEADRLEHALTMLSGDDSELRADLAATITSLRYTQMVNDAADYEAARPAMAYREDVMKRP